MLPDFKFDVKYFLEKNTLLLGETGTGKTTIIFDILHTISPYVDQILVFAPTDPVNKSYSSGTVPLPLIHYNITQKILDDIWQRQEAQAFMYEVANNPEIINALFARCEVRPQVEQLIKDSQRAFEIRRHECQKMYNPTMAAEKIKADAEKVNKFTLDARKIAIRRCSKQLLARSDLTKDERLAVTYIDLNPNMVIIFDDCTDQLKKFKTHPVIQKMFYQGRHSHITGIVACHTDKTLDPELKKNAHVTMFTGAGCAQAYFKRDSTALEKDQKMVSADAVRGAFTPAAPHQKLAWVRNEAMYYRVTARVHPGFRFGSKHLWEYCNQIRVQGATISPNNRFASAYMVT